MPGVSAVADRVVVIGSRQIARQELLDRASRAATGLEWAGVREGDAIALLIRNDPCYFEVIQAAALLGAYVVPLNWHSTAEEIAYIVADCQPRALIGHSDLIAKCTRIIPAELPTFLVDDPNDGAGATKPPHAASWSEFRNAAGPWQGPPRAPRGTMIYTSGTTGHPKGVRRAPMTPEQVKKNRRCSAKSTASRTACGRSCAVRFITHRRARSRDKRFSKRT